MEYVKGQENETDTELDRYRVRQWNNLETGKKTKTNKKKKTSFPYKKIVAESKGPGQGVGVGVGEDLRCQ